MSWVYDQRTGRMSGPNGEEYQGYSGTAGIHQNNPASESIPFQGPIPRGNWTINLESYHGAGGPFSLRLTPRGDTDTHGRGGFVIHGDRTRAPGTASEGCIVLPRAAREAIVRSGDTQLTVR